MITFCAKIILAMVSILLLILESHTYLKTACLSCSFKVCSIILIKLAFLLMISKS